MDETGSGPRDDTEDVMELLILLIMVVLVMNPLLTKLVDTEGVMDGDTVGDWKSEDPDDEAGDDAILVCDGDKPDEMIGCTLDDPRLEKVDEGAGVETKDEVPLKEVDLSVTEEGAIVGPVVGIPLLIEKEVAADEPRPVDPEEEKIVEVLRLLPIPDDELIELDSADDIVV